MGLTIHPPSPQPPSFPSTASSPRLTSTHSLPDDSDDSDSDERPSKRPRHSSHKSSIAIPGEIITEETQWMRGHGTFIPEAIARSGANIIHASLAGPVEKTNRLLTVSSIRARYSPSIGDLLIGRIVSLSTSSFWRVDISAPLHARLPLSSINLPGGILRRRTTADELQMRNYFQEGDLLAAEVQGVSSSDVGMATLHARSLKYGKLRNGVFLAVSGAGGGMAGGSSSNVRGSAGRVVRSRRQVFTLNTGAQGGGDVDVILGVNGYCWVSRHVDPQSQQQTTGTDSPRTGSGKNATVSIANLDDAVGAEIYSSQNDEISEVTRREIARVSECIKILAEGGVQVDEISVTKAYESAVDWDMGRMVDDDEAAGGGGLGLTAEGRRRILEAGVQ